jgi:hypothetical protein
MTNNIASIATDWAPSQRRRRETVETSVKLTDAPNITWRQKEKYGPATGQPYSIRFGFSWEGDGPWCSDITIYALKPGTCVGHWFSPREVIDMPQWLADIIDEATPTD